MNKLRDLRIKETFKINDLYLNGYAKLCGIYATGVYLFLCRHASKEQSCFPSKKLIAEELDISERMVYAALRNLEEWNIIRKEEQERKDNGLFLNTIYFLVDKSEWKLKPSASGADGTVCTTRHQRSAPHDINGLHHVPNKDAHSKGSHIKDIIYKEKNVKKEVVDNLIVDNFNNQNELQTSSVNLSDSKIAIGQIFTIFQSTINPTINFSHQGEIKACKYLIEKFGIENVIKATEYAVSLAGKKFAPTITTPYELKNKYAKLLIYFERQRQNKSAKTIQSL